MKLYKQYVRPHLEFAVTAWSPWTEADKECLEKVQRRAVKMISGLTSRAGHGDTGGEEAKDGHGPGLQDSHGQGQVRQAGMVRE